MKFHFLRNKELYPEYGLAFTVSNGCLGSTYGELGRKFFCDIRFLFLKWDLILSITWKKL